MMFWGVNPKPVEYPLRRMSPFRHCGHHQIRAANRIAPGEDLWVSRLVTVAALDGGNDPPPVVRFDTPAPAATASRAG